MKSYLNTVFETFIFIYFQNSAIQKLQKKVGSQVVS